MAMGLTLEELGEAADGRDSFPGVVGPGCHRGAGAREAELWLVTRRALNTRHRARLTDRAR